MSAVATRVVRVGRGLAIAACLSFAVYYMVSASFAIWHLGWTELFSDQFRQYTKLLTEPFPDNVFAPDNSHRQVTSNLVRLADIHWRGADQDIGVVAGLLVLLGVLALMVRRIVAARDYAAPVRAAAVLLVTIALMWLGSARMQMHGNESFQIYLVIASALVVLGCVESLRQRSSLGTGALALLAGAVAMLSFGSGVAVFGLLIAMLLLRRVDWRWTLGLSLGAVAGVFAYMFVLPGADSVGNMLSFAPLATLRNTATFLASFWTTSWLAYADAGLRGVDAARMATTPGGALLVASAQTVFATAGSPSLLGLASVIGALGLLLLCWRAFSAWRDPGSVGAIETLGLGLAVFAVGVAVLVALGRGDYFLSHPDQMLADRYVPWANMFWLGLALACAGRLRARRYADAAFVASALVIALMVYPSHRVSEGWAAAVEHEIEKRAAQIQTGVAAEGLALFTDSPNDASAERAVALLRAHRVAMFRAPRNHLQGVTLDALPAFAEQGADVGAPTAVTETRSAALPAWQLEGRLRDRASRRDIAGLVVVNAANRVVGIGEFGFSSDGARRARIDNVADGFDAYFRAPLPCTELRLYGVNAEATRFVALAELPDCPAP